MKTFIEILVKLCCITVMILVFSSCRLKHLSSQKFRTSADQTKDINIKTTQDDFLHRSILISIRDSTKHQYQVNIFPIDSFSFSLQDGFRGRVHAIELIRETQHWKEMSELYDSTVAKQQKFDYYEKVKASETTSGSTKDLKRRNFNFISIGVLIGVIGLAGYVYKSYYSS